MAVPILRPFGGFKPKFRASGQHDQPGSISFGSTRGSFVRQATPIMQRVVTPVSHFDRKPGAVSGRAEFKATLRRDVAYIKRDGDDRVQPFGRDVDTDGQVAVDAWGANDERYFRISLNPEKANELPDLKVYVRDTMAEVERHVLSPTELAAGHRLDWIAAVHRDTGRDHAHVILRGVAAREELWLREAFRRDGITDLAREVATRSEHLGPRAWAEVENDRSTYGIEAYERLRGEAERDLVREQQFTRDELEDDR